jgi:hypothetical protein
MDAMRQNLNRRKTWHYLVNERAPHKNTGACILKILIALNRIAGVYLYIQNCNS